MYVGLIDMYMYIQLCLVIYAIVHVHIIVSRSTSLSSLATGSTAPVSLIKINCTLPCCSSPSTCACTSALVHIEY